MRNNEFQKTIIKALKGQNHQYRATPCNWVIEPFQALKGRDFASFLITPFQGSNSRLYPFHRALPDAIAKRLSALTTVTSFLFFIPKWISPAGWGVKNFGNIHIFYEVILTQHATQMCVYFSLTYRYLVLVFFIL